MRWTWSRRRHASRKEEIYGLTAQLRRAAVSIPANIAEGRGRRNTKEFVRHLAFAFGSLTELQTHLLIAERLNYTTAAEQSALMEQTHVLAKMLNALVASLRRKLDD